MVSEEPVRSLNTPGLAGYRLEHTASIQFTLCIVVDYNG